MAGYFQLEIAMPMNMVWKWDCWVLNYRELLSWTHFSQIMNFTWNYLHGISDHSPNDSNGNHGFKIMWVHQGYI